MAIRRPPPFDFVLEALAGLEPYTKPMFGCTAVYVGVKIVFILRQRGQPSEDDGVWVATTVEHHRSLRQDLPALRSIVLFGPGETGWQTLPADDPEFESQVLGACELVLAGDPRIGKIPKSRLPKARAKAKVQKSRRLRRRR